MSFDPWVEVHVGLGGTGIQKSYVVIVQASSAHKKVGVVNRMGVERSAADCLCEGPIHATFYIALANKENAGSENHFPDTKSLQNAKESKCRYRSCRGSYGNLAEIRQCLGSGTHPLY